MMIDKSNLPLVLHHPSNVKGTLVVKEQAQVSAIRFSPTSLPTGRQACPIAGDFPQESEALHSLFFYD